MKKSGLLVAAALVAASFQANAAVPFTGATVGGSLGLGSVVGKSIYKNNGSTVQKFRLGNRNPLGGFHVGYSAIYKHMYLGIEANVTFNRFKLIEGDTSNLGTFKNRLSYGVALRNGVLITPNTLAYVTLGGQMAQWNYTNSASGFKSSKRKIAFVPGIGIETMVKKDVKVGLECTHSLERNHRFASSATASHSLRPSVTAVKVRVSYGF